MWPIKDWLWQSDKESVRQAAASGELEDFARIYAVMEAPLRRPNEYHWRIADDGGAKNHQELAALIRDAIGVIGGESISLSTATYSYASKLERRRILVYCDAGIRRSSMVCLALLCAMERQGAVHVSSLEWGRQAIVSVNPLAAFPQGYIDTILEALKVIKGEMR